MLVCVTAKGDIVVVTEVAVVSVTLTGDDNILDASVSLVPRAACLTAHLGALSGGDDDDGVDCTLGFCLNPAFLIELPSWSLSSFCIKEFNSKLVRM